MSKKILLVEDDVDAQKGLSMRLGANQYSVRIAADAASAVRMARQERPDLILLDLGLPAGGGLLALERIKKFPDLAVVPVIVITAQSGDALRKKALDAGVDAYLNKPVDNAELMNAIRNLLGEEVESKEV